MYLKRLDIHGFKSFGKKTVFDFSCDGVCTPVTAVVGPNGSGKSNVADAVRWVLGEQSTKALRGSTSEDVIFHGSASSSKARSAQVTLVLDNADNALPCDFEEVVVTRKVLRGESSQYFLNGSPCRLLDIQELLAHGRLSQRSYCIVNQGMADALLRATPVERRVLLEDAIGVKPYQIRKHHTELKLRRAERNMQRTQDRLDELRPRLRSLKRQAALIEKRKRIEEELTAAQQTYYAGALGVRAKALAQNEGKRAKVRADLTKVQKRVNAAQASLSKLQGARQSSVAEVRSLEQQLAEVQQEWNATQQQLLVYRGRLQRLQDKSADGDSAERDAAARIPEQLQELSFTKSQLEEKLEQEQAVYASALQRHQHQQSRIASITEGVQALHAELKRLESEHSVTVWDRTQLSSSLTELQSKHAALCEAFASAASLADYEQLAEQLGHFSSSLDDICLHCSPSSSAVQELDAWKALQKEIDDARTQLEQHRSHEAEERVAYQASEQAVDFYKRQLREVEQKHAQLTKEQKHVEKQSQGDRAAAVQERIDEYEVALSSLEESRTATREKLRVLQGKEQESQLALQHADAAVREVEHEKDRLMRQQNAIDVEHASLAAHLEELERDIVRDLGVSELESLRSRGTDDAVIDRQLEVAIDVLRQKLLACGAVDPLVVEEYEEIQERTTFLEEQLGDLRSSIQSMQNVIRELDATIRDTFSSSFATIQKSFREYFSLLFDGGKASLSLVNVPVKTGNGVEGSEDDGHEQGREQFELGVEVSASPPGKKLSNLSLMSGGERAITSIALLFAVMSNNPPPFSILDEVEAALDETNTRRFGDILQKLAASTQFVVITHKRETMNVADTLYGVSMQRDGVSQLLSVQLDSYDESSVMAKA